MNSRLLPSKLHMPGNRPGTLSRGRLFAPLNDALRDQHRLILISAPAGSGKTTLVSEWIARNDFACAWVALDDDDNDLARFTQYLTAATAKALAASGNGAFPDDLVAEPETIWHDFVNALLAFDMPLVIVLDDYHLIEAEIIHDGIAFLMEHLPPHVRLVLVTRSDPPLPIARLRVRQQITELREHDIRFTPPETHDFLNVTSGLHIDDGGVVALQERTEGWIVGLQLAALSLRHYVDPTEFISQFTGSHRFVLDYLTEEVLNQQNTRIQTFLLKTSILERFNADLCQVVTGEADSHGILSALYHDNLFLIPLDAAGQMYRYHHLFGDLLRVRLQQKYADDLPDLHQRAAGWYADHDDELLALRHYLASEQHRQAVELVEQESFTPYNRGNIPALINLIRQLPLDRQRPWLNAYNGMFLIISGQMEAGEMSLRRAEQTQDNPALVAFVAATRVQILHAQLQIHRAYEQAQIALDWRAGLRTLHLRDLRRRRSL